MTDRASPAAAARPDAGPASEAPPRGIARRDLMRLAALAPAAAFAPPTERILLSPGGWVLLESDLG